MTVPNGSTCFSGLKVTRPSRLRGVVAEPMGDKAVRRLVKGHGKDDRQDPGRGLPQHPCPLRRGVHAAPRLRGARRPPSTLRSAARPPPVEIVADARRRIASPRATRACGRRRKRRRGGGDLLHLGQCRRCSAMQDRSRRRGPGGALGEPAVERTHRDIVRNQHAAEADVAADDGRRPPCAKRSPARRRRSP